MASPGTNAHVEVTTQLVAADPPRDWSVNNLSFNTGGVSISAANWQALTDAIKAVWFATTGAGLYYGTNGGKVVAYDRADPLPRPEKAASLYTPGSWMSNAMGPRQDAICASFYSSRNLKNTRGRIYLPYTTALGAPVERITPSVRTNVVTFVKAIATACLALTPAWQLTVHSKVTGLDNPVTNIWCNDVPDTQRRRAPKESARTMVTFP
jgi:hypothetical protein